MWALGMGLGSSLSSLATGTGEFGAGTTKSGEESSKEVMKDLDGPRCSGVCKNYDPQKGYGFLRVEGHGKDIFFSKYDLPREFRDRVALTGHKFSFDLYLAHDGRLQAKRCIWQGIVQGPNAARAQAAASVALASGGGVTNQSLATLMGAVGGGSMHGGASLGTMLMAAGAQQNAAAAMGFIQPGAAGATETAIQQLMQQQQQQQQPSASTQTAMALLQPNAMGGRRAHDQQQLDAQQERVSAAAWQQQLQQQMLAAQQSQQLSQQMLQLQHGLGLRTGAAALAGPMADMPGLADGRSIFQMPDFHAKLEGQTQASSSMGPMAGGGFFMPSAGSSARAGSFQGQGMDAQHGMRSASPTPGQGACGALDEARGDNPMAASNLPAAFAGGRAHLPVSAPGSMGGCGGGREEDLPLGKRQKVDPPPGMTGPMPVGLVSTGQRDS